jgi:putative transposase
MERFVQYVKDRTEGFDDYFPCRRERCRFEHVRDRLPILQLSQIMRGPKDPP